MRSFAVFDIDGTLIRWQLFHAIAHSLGKYGYMPPDAHERIKKARLAWKRRTTDTGFASYEHVLVSEYLAALKNITPEEYQKVIADVFEEYKDQTFTYTRDLLHQLKAQNYFLIAISGSQQEVIEKIANHYGFDAVVGAQQEVIEGRFSGKVDTPIFQKAKILETLIAEHNLNTKDSYAIGDSASDAPMLALVDHPIAFNPDKKFFAIANEHGWKVVLERKNMVFELQKQKNGYTMESYADTQQNGKQSRDKK